MHHHPTLGPKRVSNRRIYWETSSCSHPYSILITDRAQQAYDSSPGDPSPLVASVGVEIEARSLSEKRS